MKLRISLAIAALCLVSAALLTPAMGACYSAPDTCYVCRDVNNDITELDLGVCDTVRIGCPINIDFASYAVGDSFGVPIYVYCSNAIQAFTLGFQHDGRKLQFGNWGDGAWDATGGVFTGTQASGIQWVVEVDGSDVPVVDSGSCLMGWIDLGGKKPIPRNTTSSAKLFGTLWLIMTEQIQQTVNFDSVFFPPAGPFILTCRDSTSASTFQVYKLTPKFAKCPEANFVVPVSEVSSPALPQRYELRQNVPNPFNPNTAITFAVPRPSQVRIDVFNVMGQRVRTLADEYSKAGYKRVEWDGTDANGNAVASGVYLYRMTAGDFSQTKKMLLLK